jgi:hypothetical protein
MFLMHKDNVAAAAALMFIKYLMVKVSSFRRMCFALLLSWCVWFAQIHRMERFLLSKAPSGHLGGVSKFKVSDMIAFVNWKIGDLGRDARFFGYV